MFSAVGGAGRKIIKLPVILSHFLPSCPCFLWFLPQAGVKGKLGRLLGVFEVSKVHQSQQKFQTICDSETFLHLNIYPPLPNVPPAKPGPEASDVRLRVDGDGNTGGLGGLGQHRYAAAANIYRCHTPPWRSGSSFTLVLDAVIYVQAYILHGQWGEGGEPVNLGRRSCLHYVTAVSWHMRP